jgi:hypothetical protein
MECALFYSKRSKLVTTVTMFNLPNIYDIFLLLADERLLIELLSSFINI